MAVAIVPEKFVMLRPRADLVEISQILLLALSKMLDISFGRRVLQDCGQVFAVPAH